MAMEIKRGFSDPDFCAGRKSQHDRIVEKLIDAAMDVLHHDRTDGSEVDKYERNLLSQKFCTILAVETSDGLRQQQGPTKEG